MKTINWISFVITLTLMLGCKINNSNQPTKISKVDSKVKNSNIIKQVICKGINAEISIEKNIYVFPNQTNYYLKFFIKNTSKMKLGIDLTNSIKQFYPNHWCFYCSISEGINEGGRVVQSANNYDTLKTNFNNGRQTIIDKKEEIHYYRNICKYDDEIINFNNILKQEDFFRIRLDGQLIITNGNEIEEFRLDNKSIEERLVIFNLPILKKQIPNDEYKFVNKVIVLRPQGE
jgi:hypothetical protein